MHNEPDQIQEQRRESAERVSPRMLRRLVDGELSAEEYRLLLAALDEHPAGWRQCALAFLEAQALMFDLGKLLDSTHARLPAAEVPPTASVDPAIAPSPSPRRPQPSQDLKASALRGITPVWRFVGRGLSLAACLLVGLVAGLWSPWRAEPRSGRGDSEQPSGPQVAVASPERGLLAPSPGRAWGTVRLAADSESPQQPQVPVYELPAMADSAAIQRWLSEGAPLAGELEELLRRGGFEVQRHQHLLAAPLDDGRHAIVPVEGYYLQPARWTY